MGAKVLTGICCWGAPRVVAGMLSTDGLITPCGLLSWMAASCARLDGGVE